MKTTKTAAGKYSLIHRNEIYSIIKEAGQWNVYMGSDSKPCIKGRTKKEAIAQIA